MQMFFLDGRWMSIDQVRERNSKLRQHTPEVPEDVEDKNPLECPYCGIVLKNKIGFISHTRACKKKLR